MAIWEGMEERLQKKLLIWKRQYISKGARLTLIRNTLSNMPIYFYVFALYAKKSQIETGANPKGFSLGRRGFCVEASFSKVVYYLLR